MTNKNSTTGAQGVSEALVRLGVTHIFGMDTPEPLYIDLDQSIRAITIHDERAGAVMADAFARTSGRVGVCGAIRGPGATNLLSGLAEAYNSSTPVLALVNDVATANLDRNPIQGIDHVRLFEQVTKWGRRVDTSERTADYVVHAMRVATTGRPGPVLLAFPDSALTNGPVNPVQITEPAAYPRVRVSADPALIKVAAQQIESASRPIMIAGGGLHLSQGYEALQALAERRQIPVATTPLGKGAIAEIHPLAAGVVGAYTAGPGARGWIANQAVREADLVVLVGTKTDSIATNDWTIPAVGQQIIHIDIDPLELGRTYPALEIAADAKLALDQLVQSIAPRTKPCAWTRELQSKISDWQANFEALEMNSETIDPRLIYRSLNALLGEDDIVTTDASYSSAWGMDLLRYKKAGRKFLAPRGFAGLGWGVPAAIGAKFAKPEAAVFCVTGDGGFGYVAMEMETAARYDVPICVIVLNNGILGFQRHYEIHRFGKTIETSFTAVNYADLARTLNCDGIRVTTPAEFEAALQKSRGLRRPLLIDVVTPPDARPPISTFAYAPVDARH
ncbi:acetolactate synthase catalytic subunit [Bradyrhizobium diazoefficiens]|uniref:thiamine pyrophosphate-dependent enzyme n=1 Tax=Bradyrhizobium diazoefficiens TaxID=1355477 RepID=UPI00190C01C1|nr:thiamine pyrophosphate-dependent enzyme [Bradyrhizobium diazoefficiens]QQO13872.1 acetolactate synthase catalytic subunit [Bradyrhizobium diazoefficiens]